MIDENNFHYMHKKRKDLPLEDMCDADENATKTKVKNLKLLEHNLLNLLILHPRKVRQRL